MEAEITQSPSRESIIQFSLFADNKVGRLNDILQILAAKDIHIMALCTLDTTDSTLIRFIPDYPDATHQLLRELGYTFTESEMIAVTVAREQQLHEVTCALLMCEINIHYIYPFLIRPNEESALALRVEDNDLARSILSERGLKVLTQRDIAR